MAKLTPTGSATPDMQRHSDDLPGERRQVTVLFADMVGFTSISEQLGEERTYALIRPIYELMAAAVREQGGSVKDFTGDGIMALFGVPLALEDAPQRACRAGLLIQQRLAQKADDIETTHGVKPEMRIGINSGLVVVARIEDGEGIANAFGDTVNFASRLQSLAEPGTVFLSEATNQLVEGMVETEFAGKKEVKGKLELQSVFRVKGIREGSARFDRAIRRGLTQYVGRVRELQLLNDNIRNGDGVRVIDVVGEAGIGKSRLLHEFRETFDTQQFTFLAGHCSQQGRATAFLPFIEVVRSAFQVEVGENERDVARKLKSGLATLELATTQNVGLLLNLLGLRPPEGALSGLDGVLIGLRTRDLLLKLLQRRCRIKPLILVLEDLHWSDGASEGLLSAIVSKKEPISLIVLHTRRPEYQPSWLGRANVSTLALAPLSAKETSLIFQRRLGFEELPADLAYLISDRADGNALFAEELASFLLERDVIRRSPSGLVYDEHAVAAAMPASIQLLLTARVDQLAPNDRKLLQVASVIGRRFEADLLASVAGSIIEIDSQLATMARLDLVYEDSLTGEPAFKHALVHDALYSSLLLGPRSALHLKIADEIERRSNNRLAEVAEVLAHHYAHTECAEKGFLYAAMAAKKSLGVYSLGAAEDFCKSALSLLRANPECATDEAVAQFLLDYTLVLQLVFKVDVLIETLEAWLFRVDRLGNHRLSAAILHNYVHALGMAARYEEARAAERKLAEMANALRDDVSTVYAFIARSLIDSILAPRDAEDYNAEVPTILAMAREANDRYLSIWLHWVIGWDAFHRGLILKCYSYAHELMAIGRRVNDPRALGYGLWLMGYAAVVLEDYPAALSYAERALDVAKTPMDSCNATGVKAITLVLQRRLEEGYPLLLQSRQENATAGQHYARAASDAFFGVALVLQGNFAAGIRQIKRSIAEQESKGYRNAADWARMILCDVYLEILEAKEIPPLKVLFRNLATIVYLKLFGLREISQMMAVSLSNHQFAPEGIGPSKMHFLLGRREKLAGNRRSAKFYLEKAKRTASLCGDTPILRKIETQLNDLSTINS